jgi:ubiquinone/menaquinone biosynthesis C-methylase UbiE
MNYNDFQDLFEMEQKLWWFRGMNYVTDAQLGPILNKMTNPEILDIGCGTGGMMLWLQRFSTKVSGLDISEVALDFCMKNGLDRLHLGSATSLPIPAESMDIVTCLDVLVQLPGEMDDLLAMQEIQRVLKPGGYAFIRAAAFEWMRGSHDVALNSRRRYSRSELVKKVSQSGFLVQYTGYANMFLFPLALIHRLILQPIGIISKGSDVKPLPGIFSKLNKPFSSILKLEATLMTAGISLPFGLSVVLLLKKPC